MVEKETGGFDLQLTFKKLKRSSIFFDDQKHDKQSELNLIYNRPNINA